MSLSLMSNDFKHGRRQFLERDLKIGKFPDSTQMIRIDIPNPHLLTETVQILWEYESDEELASLIFITRYLQDKGFENIYLAMPYIPNARFDRINNDDEVFTLKYFAEVINSLHFRKVFVLDAHSNVSLALIDNIEQYNVKSRIEEVINEFNPDVLFMPDEGAHKRYSKMFDLPSTFGIKTRDWRSGEIKNYILADPDVIKQNKRVLIIDDICSKGGTFYYASKLLKENGAKDIALYISHCEKSIEEGKLLNQDISGICDIYTADTLWNREEISENSPLNKIKKV